MSRSDNLLYLIDIWVGIFFWVVLKHHILRKRNEEAQKHEWNHCDGYQKDEKEGDET